jgi:hypothetical protein
MDSTMLALKFPENHGQASLNTARNAEDVESKDTWRKAKITSC